MGSSKKFARELTSLVKIMGIISLTHNLMASAAYKRLATTNDDTGIQKPQRGYVFMYVGEERKIYEVPVDYLNYPMIEDLMKKLLQDGGLECTIGPIVLLCNTEVFDQVLEECARYTIQ